MTNELTPAYLDGIATKAWEHVERAYCLTGSLAPDVQKYALDDYGAFRAARGAWEAIVGLGGCQWEPMYSPELRRPCREREGEQERVGVVRHGTVELEERVFSFPRDGCYSCRHIGAAEATLIACIREIEEAAK